VPVVVVSNSEVSSIPLSYCVPDFNAMAEISIIGWDIRDVRFPTSLDKTGSDAMNAAGDYSAAYCILKTDSKYSGHGMVCSERAAQTAR
jgi:hypothetical protein